VTSDEALGIYQAGCTTESDDSVVIVHRSRIPNSTFDAMKRRTFSCFKNLNMKYFLVKRPLMMVDQGENFSGTSSSVCFAMYTVHTVYIMAIYHYMARQPLSDFYISTFDHHSFLYMRLMQL